MQKSQRESFDYCTKDITDAICDNYLTCFFVFSRAGEQFVVYVEKTNKNK